MNDLRQNLYWFISGINRKGMDLWYWVFNKLQYYTWPGIEKRHGMKYQKSLVNVIYFYGDDMEDALMAAAKYAKKHHIALEGIGLNHGEMAECVTLFYREMDVDDE